MCADQTYGGFVSVKLNTNSTRKGSEQQQWKQHAYIFYCINQNKYNKYYGLKQPDLTKDKVEIVIRVKMSRRIAHSHGVRLSSTNFDNTKKSE